MKRMIDVRKNHLEFTMDSNSTKDSVIRFYFIPVSEVEINWSGRARTYLVPLLQKHLIILAYGRAENDTRHAFKTMDPLLSLRPLTADVEHMDPEVPRQNL